MTLSITAAEAFERYQSFFNDDRLIQGDWHAENDGRQLACALGAIEPEIEEPGDCPASVMPRWLAQTTPWFFDYMAMEDARQWGLEFFAELKRLGGQVPFSVVYDWHANYTTVLAIEVTKAKGRDAAPHRKLQALHQRALTGDTASREEWRSSCAYAYADANAYAYAYAYANTRQDRVKRLGFGMIDCIRRVPAPATSEGQA